VLQVLLKYPGAGLNSWSSAAEVLRTNRRITMTMLRYNPVSLDRTLPGDFKQLLEKFWNVNDDDQSNVVTSQWTPRVDVREEAQRFVIQCDIPGVDPSAIDISMEKGVLTIKGERKSESVSEGEKYTRVERSHGLFHRRFGLPDSADAEGISASGKHGVLEIVIPKKPEQTARRIQINA
jgi:HSP20 family protein